MGTPTNKDQLAALVREGESSTLEFKRTTSEIKEAMHTLCGFLNSFGGVVLFGVRSNGAIEGQQVSDQTLRDIAQATDRFEPATNVAIHRVKIKPDHEVIVLSVERGLDSQPFSYDGRPYERVGSTTRRMSQSKFNEMILARSHSTRRWENAPAEHVTIRDIDRNEVLRIVNEASAAGRLIGPSSSRLPDMLDRLRVSQNGKILQAAVVLFGKEFMPYYPQCEIRMARFRGTDKTEFLDQKHIRTPAFKLLEEAEIFCHRHFPLPGKIVPGRLQRVDTPLIPPDAMREILVNAIIHRDYSIYGGAISLAIFDDRVEVWSAGKYPKGITPAMLSRRHTSVQRNPIIADVFHRAGLIENWGRGTNRVAEMCRAAGIAPPTFEEIANHAVVTFKVKVGMTAATASTETKRGRKPESGQSQARVGPKSILRDNRTPIELRVLAALADGPLKRHDIVQRLGHKALSGGLKKVFPVLLRDGWIEYTIPEKPNSRLQQYLLTAAGERVLSERLRQP